MAPDSRLPKHLAVIMDGNGRWARKRGWPRTEGHLRGMEAARAVVTRCRELGIPHLTLYTFSRENWSRPKTEVSFLFELLVRYLKSEADLLMEQDIRFQVLGEVGELPRPARGVVLRTIEKTAANRSMVLNFALNYSSRHEIVRAARRMLREGLDPESVTEETFSDYLYTAGQPDPDLVVRTSGELRLSNYLLYQCAYAELHFTETLWPDFTPAELDRILADFALRERRFGTTGDQPDS